METVDGGQIATVQKHADEKPTSQHGYDEVRRNEQCLEDQSRDNKKRQEGEERRYKAKKGGKEKKRILKRR